MHSRPQRIALIGGILAATAALSACSGGAADTAAPSTDQEIGSIDLAAAGCPATVTVQTDWVPESEHGHLYELLGDEYTVDAGNKSVSGPLMASGEYTGVNVEIRAGGPAIGYTTVGAQMAEDPDITMGYIGNDSNIQNSAQFDYTAVFAPLDVSPFMLMWDPETYPDVTDIESLDAALAETGGVVRYFGASSPYIDYMVNEGILTDPDARLDGSYDGTPASFVAAGGKDAQQGFASAEPYIYENEVEAWNKPVDYQLINDTGWTPYSSAVSVRTPDVEAMSGCLAELVPVLQQAEVDYVADPSTAVATILDLTEQYDLGFPYSEGVAEYSVETMKETGIIGNGPNDTIGDFDEARVADFFDKAVDTFASLDVPVEPKEGLTAADTFTNQFIDTSIGLP